MSHRPGRRQWARRLALSGLFFFTATHARVEADTQRTAPRSKAQGRAGGWKQIAGGERPLTVEVEGASGNSLRRIELTDPGGGRGVFGHSGRRGDPLKELEVTRDWSGDKPEHASLMTTPLGQRRLLLYRKNHYSGRFEVMGRWWAARQVRGDGEAKFGTARGGPAFVELEELGRDEDDRYLVRIVAAQGKRVVDFVGHVIDQREGPDGIRLELMDAYGYKQRRPRGVPEIGFARVHVAADGTSSIQLHRSYGKEEIGTIRLTERREADSSPEPRVLSSSLRMFEAGDQSAGIRIDAGVGDERLRISGFLQRRRGAVPVIDDVEIYPLDPTFEPFDAKFEKRFDLGPRVMKQLLSVLTAELRAAGLRGSVELRGLRITGARAAFKGQGDGAEVRWRLDLTNGRLREVRPAKR